MLPKGFLNARASLDRYLLTGGGTQWSELKLKKYVVTEDKEHIS